MPLARACPFHKLKAICYIFNGIFVAFCITCVAIYLVALKVNVTRRLQIMTTCKSISILPSLPYYIGVFFEEPDLIFPNVVIYMFTIITDILIMVFWSFVPLNHSVNEGFMIVLSVISIAVSIMCMFQTVLLVRNLVVARKEKGEEKQSFGDYPLKRFDAIPIKEDGMPLKTLKRRSKFSEQAKTDLETKVE